MLSPCIHRPQMLLSRRLWQHNMLRVRYIPLHTCLVADFYQPLHMATLCINYLAFARLIYFSNETFLLAVQNGMGIRITPKENVRPDRGAPKIPSSLTLFWIKYRNIGTWKKLIIYNTLKYTCIQLKVKGSVSFFFFLSSLLKKGFDNFTKNNKIAILCNIILI